MGDKFIMMDVLSTEKWMTVNTVTAMNEASSSNIYNAFNDLFNQLTMEVKEIFGICYSNNWYPLEEAQTTKIDQEYTKLCGELNKED